MPWRHWKTKGPGRHQRDRWQDVVCRSMLNIELKVSEVEPFHFKLAQMSIGDSKVFRFRSTPHGLDRSPAMAARGGGENYMVSTQITGSMAIRSGEADIVLRPGDVGILDTTQPFSAKMLGDTSRAIVLIEKRRFGSSPPLPNGTPAGILTGAHPYGRIIRQYILSLTDIDHDHPPDIADALTGTLANAISYAGSTIRLNSTSRKTITTHDVNDYISSHYSDSTLTPTYIAAALGISLRKLFALYEGAPLSVEQTIIRARLHAVLDIISSLDFRHETLTSIAIRCGFKDSAHFSRKFRQLYGVSPSSLRAGSAIREWSMCPASR